MECSGETYASSQDLATLPMTGTVRHLSSRRLLRRLFAFFICLFLVVLSVPAHPVSAECVDYGGADPPLPLSSVDTPSYSLRVDVSGDLALVADWMGGLVLVDISDPVSPQIVGRTEVLTPVLDVAVSGTKAYVTAEYLGLLVVDFSDPTGPSIIGGVDTPGWALAVDVSGAYAYVADGYAGLLVIDVSEPDSARVVSRLELPGDARDVVVIGATAYLADGSGGLQLVSVADAEAPVVIGSAPTAEEAHGLTVQGDHVYVAVGPAGIQVFDVTDLGNPVAVGGRNTPGYAFEATAVGPILYVADDFAGLQVMDISVPAEALTIGSALTPGDAMDVEATSSCLLVADWSAGLQIYPLQCGEVSGACCLPGDICLFTIEAMCEGGWSPGTLCEPNPCVEPVGACCTEEECSVRTRQECEDLGSSYQGDGTECTPTLCQPSAVGGGSGALAVGSVAVFPNPFVGDVVIRYPSQTTAVRIELFDSGGRAVRELSTGPPRDGRLTARWDGRDVQGLRLPSGVYHVKITSGSVRAGASVILLR